MLGMLISTTLVYFSVHQNIACCSTISTASVGRLRPVPADRELKDYDARVDTTKLRLINFTVLLQVCVIDCILWLYVLLCANLCVS